MILVLLLLMCSCGHLLLMLLLLLLLGQSERSHHVGRCSASDATTDSRGSLLGVIALLLGLAVVQDLLELLVLLVIVKWLLRAGLGGVCCAVMAAHEVVRRLECLLVQGDLCHIFLLPGEHELSFLLVLATGIAGVATATLCVFLQLFDPVTIP